MGPLVFVVFIGLSALAWLLYNICCICDRCIRCFKCCQRTKSYHGWKLTWAPTGAAIFLIYIAIVSVFGLSISG